MADFKDTITAFEDFAKRVRRMARYNLTRERANATRRLWDSIDYELTQERGTIRLQFKMNYYGAFLDQGVTGTGQLYQANKMDSPVPYNRSDARNPEYRFRRPNKVIGGDLSAWFQARRIPADAEYLIRRSVHARGIRPRRFFTQAWNRWIRKLNDQIDPALTEDVEQVLNEILAKIEN